MAQKRKLKPKTFFQKLQDAFKRLFTAPSQTRAEKQRAKIVRDIKKAGYSPSYEKRLIRAVQKGETPSLQRARGHKPGEAKQRREREVKQNGGLTSAQIRSINNFHSRFDPRGDKRNPTANQFIEYAQRYGYERFTQYRDAWKQIRQNYEKDLRRGTYASRGESAFISVEDFEEEIEDLGYDDSDLWFYYH